MVKTLSQGVYLLSAHSVPEPDLCFFAFIGNENYRSSAVEDYREFIKD